MAFKPKILIAESDPALMHTLNSTLSAMGAETVCLTDGNQGDNYINRQKFDGFFVDYRMPGVDGIELAKMIRASGPNRTSTLVMLADGADTSALKDSFRTGANFVLQKPLNAGHIGSMLNASRGMMLEERRRHQRANSDFILLCQWNNTDTRGICANISATGCLADLREVPDAGTVAALEFTLPGDSKPLKIKTIVVRVTKDEQVAFQFANLEHAQKKQIMEFTDRMLGNAATA